MYDFAIIGSGAAGGRVAYDLTSAGATCVMLEAGKAFEATTYPGEELDYTAQMFWGAGLEFAAGAHLAFLRGKCLGGGTIVNQALMDQNDEVAFSDWFERSGVDFFNCNDMAPHYEAAEGQMELKELPPERRNKSALLFIQALENLGVGWKSLRRAEGDCASEHGSDCMVCLGGCPRDSKQSSLVTTIRRALENGLTVETEFLVNNILDGRDKVTVFGSQRGERTEINARKVVLCAGAFGSTSILLKSASLKLGPTLGRGFSCHPQYMTYAIFDDIIDQHKGTFQTVKSDDPKLRKAGYKLENVSCPPSATALLFPRTGLEHLEMMKLFRHQASMEVCIRDEPAGNIRLDKRGGMVIEKPFTAQDQRRVTEGRELIRDLFASLKPKKIIECEQGFGLHLVGGCCMGVDPSRSVVNPEYQLHDHPNIFVADGSLFPSATGINPCLTIVAMAHRCGQSILGSS
jgi:choline dehydrogenase-like flavoprotein